MKCLVVITHPDTNSLCHALARSAIATLTKGGHTVEVEDLYLSNFPPALTPEERRRYYGPDYAPGAVRDQMDRLLAAEGLVLVFPTWWFSFPATLKGWFDRVWAPGVAYDHAADLGPIRPRLSQLRRALAVTSLGSPWWADRLILRQPVRRVLRTALLGTCAPACRLEMLSLYRAEALDMARVTRFTARIERTLARWS